MDKVTDYIKQKAYEYYKAHMQASEDWKKGDIEKMWLDAEGNICIQYEDGNWWHYNEKGEWW